jgi:tricorn protease
MKCLRKLIILALVLLLAQPILTRAIASSQSNKAAVDSVPSFAEPALSPDRSEIAFVSGGDIWTAPAAGGEARLLVSHPATESRPLYSPDGRKLAFTSNRTGNGDIYVLTFDTGDLKRLTFDDGNDQLDAWSRDGRWIYFTSSTRDIAGMNDLFRVGVDGGTPMPVSADRYATEYFSAPSPDGKGLAFTARGNQSGQWWRKGHSHLDECEIWLIRDLSTPRYEQITERGAKNMWPMWSAEGNSIFYVSDRGGAQNIWTVSAQGPGADKDAGSSPSSPSRKGYAEARPVTKFKDGRVVWPTISYDGRAIVFERNFAIWKMDTGTGQASEVPITRRGAAAGPSVEHLRLTDQIQELALSPDGKKVAFVVRGEVFAASAKDGGDAARVTNSPFNDSQIAWAPDSRKLAYVSDREGPPHVYLYDFTSNTETQLTRDTAGDAAPGFSPDGKSLAFQRDAREMRVMDLESKLERLLASGVFERPPISSTRPFVWSPDNKWIAFTSVSGKSFTNVLVVPAAGGETKQLSFLANVFNDSVSWSPDGAFILFDTAQRTEGSQIARVDLIPRTPRFREDQFRDLFKEESPRTSRTAPPPQEDRPAPSDAQNATAAAPSATEKKPPPKPVEIVFEDIKKRLSLLPVGVDASNQEISPDGKWLLMTASAAGQQNLYIYSLDELAREPAVARQLTSTPGFKRDAQFSPDSKEVFFLEQGRINVVALDNRTPRPLAVNAEIDVDFAREKIEVFNQAWSYLRDQFYDPKYHGIDWQAVRADYAPRIAGARTPDEMRRLLSLMVGELNASHSGVSAPFSANQAPTGRLGLRFDRTEYESGGRLRVNEVIPLGPAALAGVKTGEYLLAIDGTQIGARVNIDELLSFKTARRVLLTVSASSDAANKRELAVRPVTTATEKGLLYRKWVEEKREYVAKISGGRLGYVHMYDMGQGSLAQLFIDLDTENHSRDGVVVDVRNNNGGFVNAYAIDVLARRGYMIMTRRGFPAAPARTVLGQRALEAPTVLVTNQHSLSDAEDFTEGYRALKLGKVVGEPTAGWIIYTSGATLIDGTNIRLPFIKITSSDGKLMELAPRPVDVAVVRPIGESYTGHDVQLETAVKELLKQIGNGNQ